MGQPQSNNTAVFAVILVALILFLFIGGAVVVLGGLLFFASSEVQMQQVTVSPDFAPLPADVVRNPPLIKIDDVGQITVKGQVYTADELRTHLELEVETDPAETVVPRLLAAVDCPEEVRAEVIAICEEVTGNTPQMMVSAVPGDPLTVEPPNPADEITEEGE